MTMGKIEANVDFPASQEKVWAVVSDFSRWGEWFTIHKSWKSEVPAEPAVGSTLTGVVSVLNMPNTITWTVDTFESPNTLSISGKGMAGAQLSVTMTVAADGEGSTLSLVSTFEGQMIVGAIGAAIERAGRADLATSLADLAALVS
jgi:carbon monoxide dehydrogenase subunit G